MFSGGSKGKIGKKRVKLMLWSSFPYRVLANESSGIPRQKCDVVFSRIWNEWKSSGNDLDKIIASINIGDWIDGDRQRFRAFHAMSWLKHVLSMTGDFPRINSFEVISEIAVFKITGHLTRKTNLKKKFYVKHIWWTYETMQIFGRQVLVSKLA